MPYSGDGKQMSIRFPASLYKRLKECADKAERSVNYVVVKMLEASFKESPVLPPSLGPATPRGAEKPKQPKT